MDLDLLLQNVNADIYNRLQRAVETGRWPNGTGVTEEQRSNAMQIIIAWDSRNKPETERTGYLPPKPARTAKASVEERPLRLRDPT